MREGKRWLAALVAVSVLGSACANSQGDRRPAGGAWLVVGGLAFTGAALLVNDERESHLNQGLNDPNSVELEVFANKQEEYANWYKGLAWTGGILFLSGIVTLIVWGLSPEPAASPTGTSPSLGPEPHGKRRGLEPAKTEPDPEQDDGSGDEDDEEPR